MLTIVAAVVLLGDRSLSRPVFDLLLGLNRWVLRVVAYSALMTDTYSPFRLDVGPDEPGAAGLAVASRSTAGHTAERMTRTSAGTYAGTSVGTSAGTAVGPAGNQGPDRPSWSAGRIATLVISGLLLIVSMGIGAGGAALLVVDTGLRDGQGFHERPGAADQLGIRGDIGPDAAARRGRR